MTIYSTGTVSVTNGSATVTGGGSAWAVSLVTGGMFSSAGVAIPIASVESDTSLTLAYAWPGTTAVGAAYAIGRESSDAATVVSLNTTLSRVLVTLSLAGIHPNASGTLTDRDLLDLDATDEGFLFLHAEIGVAFAFYRWSGTAWEGPFAVADSATLAATEAAADAAEAARDAADASADAAAASAAEAAITFVTRGAYNPATAYLVSDVVSDAGSSWVARQATTGNAPPVLPTTSNTYWNLLSAKGADGSAIGIENPQGRLSVVSGVAIPTSDVVAATTLYYVPCIGTRVPVWDGTQMVLRDIGAGLSVALSATYQVASAQLDWFVFMDGTTLRLGHGPLWTAGAVAGTQFARGTGAGSTDIEIKSGVWTNKNSIVLRFGSSAGNTVTIAANKATYVGSSDCGATAGTITDSRLIRALYNAYNQTPRPIALVGVNATWTYSVATFRQWNADANNQVFIHLGLPTLVKLQLMIDAGNSTTTPRACIAALGLNSTTTEITGAMRNRSWAWLNGPNAVMQASYEDIPSIGSHRFYALERGGGSDTQTWNFFSAYGIRGSAVI